jgi:hypothetical protein
MRSYSTTLPLYSLAWTLKILKLKYDMLLNFPTDDLVSDAEILKQKHKKYEKHKATWLLQKKTTPHLWILMIVMWKKSQEKNIQNNTIAMIKELNRKEKNSIDYKWTAE